MLGGEEAVAGWNVKLLKADMLIRRSDADEEPTPHDRIETFTSGASVERYRSNLERDSSVAGRAMTLGLRFLDADHVFDSDVYLSESGRISSLGVRSEDNLDRDAGRGADAEPMMMILCL